MGELVFGHGGRVGDCVWHLPCMIDLAKRNGKHKFTLLLKENMPVGDNFDHPCGRVCMNKAIIESFIPLMKVQPYISDCRIWAGESMNDFDAFRWQRFDFAKGDIATWPTMVYPCTPNLTTPWLSVGAVTQTNRVLVGRSGRYRNNAISYRGMDAHFVGLESENDTGLPHLKTYNFLELAREIAGCRAFFGNQSAAFAIASALDVKRYLEVCKECPNVGCHTHKSMLIWNQQQLTAVTAKTPATS